MLNTQSAYFKDQLVEKLQLMMAIRELYIIATTRHKGDVQLNQSITFQVSATQEEWKVEYNSKLEQLDLPAALKTLADKMTETMHAYLGARFMEIEPDGIFEKENV